MDNVKYTTQYSMAEVSKLSVKGQIVNILGFAGHSVCVAVSHLCSCSAKAALNHMQTNGTGVAVFP